MDDDRYTYQITWSVDAGRHLGTVAEFPSLMSFGNGGEEAFSGIRQKVRAEVTGLQTRGEAVPQAMAEKRYSGKFHIRITPELHRRLMIQAAVQKISINRLVAAKLAADA